MPFYVSFDNEFFSFTQMFVTSHVWVLFIVLAKNNSLPVTDVCLGCICEAASGCDRSLGCAGEVCGLFRITWPYWSDSGKPTQQGETPDSPTGIYF